MVTTGGNEAPEQGVWSQGSALELRVELTTDKERMVPYLSNLDEPSVRGGTGENHTGPGKGVPVAVIDLVAVAVTLLDEVLAVDLVR